MKRQFREPTTGNASICFTGEANEEIKLSLESNVEAGKLGFADVFLVLTTDLYHFPV